MTAGTIIWARFLRGSWRNATYLISGDLAKVSPLQLGPSGWRTWRMTKIYDLSDPAKPVFIRDFGLTFPNAPDPTGKVSVDFGVYGVPETFFVDRQGRIRAKHVGAVTDHALREQLDRLLAEVS